MKVKQEVLQILEENREVSISGQSLAEKLSVSRTAIWKAVKQLQEEGYQIQAGTNRGYYLKGESDVLSAEGIQLHLQNKKIRLHIHKSLDSTNTEAKRMALEGAKEGTVVLSEQQTMGRGRLGRSFISPKGTGIYMSIILKPTMDISNAVLLTTAASVAVCRGIRKILQLEPTIKWVNDVFLGDRKVCGILTEAVSDFETGAIESVIVGIGINYQTPKDGFIEELDGIAGALVEKSTTPRNTLIAAILDELFQIYEEIEKRTFIEDYRTWSNVLGQTIKYRENDNWIVGTALYIDDQGGLIVQHEDGSQKTLWTGEISVRKV